MWTTKATWMALAVTIVVLARGLPPETFFVGDPGVKLVAARTATNHPRQPLEIPLPEIGGERVPFVEPFFELHGDHTHAVTSEIFPVMSAPFIALFGIRGAYVLPVLGFLLAIWSCARLATAINSPASSATVMLTAALGTPLLFYGLEFWEHAPAVGIAAFASSVLVKRTTTAGTGEHSFTRNVFVGLLYGISILLRPEAAWFFLAVVVSSRLLASPPRWSAVGVGAAGIALALSPLLIYSVVHFGTISPPHIDTQANLLTIGWLNTRADIISAWFAPDGLRATPLWGCALLLSAVAGFAMAGWRGSPGKFLASVVLVDVALVVLTSPNDGGGQWAPRYLLFAFIPVSVLLADAMQMVTRRTAGGIAVAVLLLAAGGWIQRSGYRELRGTKIIYGRILDFVRHEVPAGGVAVTDLWWLDQVAASATADRVILFAGSPATATEILSRLDRAGQTLVTLLSDRGTSQVLGAQHSCYEEVQRAEISDRALQAARLRRKEPCTR